MSEAIATNLIVAGAAIIAASLPTIIKYFTDKEAHKQTIQIEEIRHTQELENRRLDNQHKYSEERLARLRPIYTDLMSNIRYIERQTITIGTSTFSANDEASRNGLTGSITLIQQAENTLSNQLRLLDVEPGANDVVQSYLEFANKVDQLISGVLQQFEQGNIVIDKSEVLAQIRQQTTKVQKAIHAHLNQLEIAGDAQMQ